MKYQLYGLSVLLLFFCQVAQAHNTQQASFNLVLNGENSFIDIGVSQYGIEQALLKSTPNLDLHENDLTTFKEVLVKHLKENIDITLNGKALKIGGGLIKLGSHQSNVKFKIDNVKEKPKNLDVKVTCFDKNDRQVNIFKVSYGTKKARHILHKDNDYQGYFSFIKPKIETSDQAYNLVKKPTT